MAEKKENQLPANDLYDDEINLADIFQRLWRQRGKIVVLSVLFFVLIFGSLGLFYLVQPKQYVARLDFRIEFDGVDRGEYPNGLKFSTADILSIPVLNEVYETNNLEQYMPFADFKSSLNIYQTNEKMKFLEYEYAAKLADRKLGFEERQQLEAEFLEKKKNLLTPIYSLTFTQDTLVRRLPDNLVAKILNDTLNTWAAYAERVKGANQYQLSLMSPNVLNEEELVSQDYVIGTDILREMARRIKADLNKLESIPGAVLVTIEPNQTTLSDLEYRVRDLEQYKLSPLIGTIRQTGIAKNKIITLSYLQHRLFELNLETEKAGDSRLVYEKSMRQYVNRMGQDASANISLDENARSALPDQSALKSLNVPAMIPQFGDTFLDSIIEMAQQNSDAQYRQDLTNKLIQTGLSNVSLNSEMKYYKELIGSISRSQTAQNQDFDRKSIESYILQTQKDLLDSLSNTIKDANKIYAQVNQANLNPESVLFSITNPILFTNHKTIGVKQLILIGVLSFFILGALTILSFLFTNK